MKDFKLKYKQFGERSILIEWPSKINEIILEDVLLFKNTLQSKYIKEKVYINSAYNSILITYNLTIDNIYDEISALKSLYLSKKLTKSRVAKLWKIPVCYDAVFGIDLEEISVQNNISKPKIIELHSQAIYTVYFIGFLPGFLYLGGLNKLLHFPRKSKPRLKVEKGAVGIGGEQTGVYPNQSPGGWNIIGNSPVHFFDATQKNPCFVKAGDKIQFIPIDMEAYKEISILLEANVYELESEIIDG